MEVCLNSILFLIIKNISPMLAPMHLLYLFGAGFRMALSSVRNNDLLSSQLARTGMAKKNKKPQTKKDTKPGHTQMYYNSSSLQVRNILQDVPFDHIAVEQLPVTNDQHPLMELLPSHPPLDGSEALCQTGASPFRVCYCHCWLALSYLSSDPSFLL